ncbi:MAG: tetratricopeptide repeat protein [Muribaculaceae bacterium]|nr:tetratricopeptide repeat protein [Muribaculaceae bacterium]
MTEKKSDNHRKEIYELLRDRKVMASLRALENTARTLSRFDITDKARELEQTYYYVLSYLIECAEDPQREKMLEDIMSAIYDAADSLDAIQERDKGTSLYAGIKRMTQEHDRTDAVSRAVMDWEETYRRSVSMSSLFADASENENGVKNLLENREIQLFNTVWTSYPLSNRDAEALKRLLTGEETPFNTVFRITSALGLAACQYPDRSVIALLADIYAFFSETDEEDALRITACALFWLVVILYRYRTRTFETSLSDRLRSLTETRFWDADVRNIFMELVRARDTERIKNTVQEQLMPEMLSVKADIEKNLRNRELDLSELSENPEWEEMLAKSGLTERLKELTELQMEGADVFLGTFEKLKNFPFFNEVANWFTPMNRESREIEKRTEGKPDFDKIVRSVEKLPFLCDSDKYSVILSLDLLPAGQLDMLLGQADAYSFENENSTIQEDRSKRLRKNLRDYIHNVYRFVNIFRRKSEFYNIFRSDMDLCKVPLLNKSIIEESTLMLIGEFYFKNGYYADSLVYFDRLDAMDVVSSVLYQKMGFAYLKLGDARKAVRFLEQAELLDHKSRWTGIQLARAHRALDEPEKAVEVLKRLEKENPDDLQIASMQGYALLQAERYSDALGYFHKACFIAPEDKALLRPVAWTYFKTRRFEESERYYRQLVEACPCADDYLNSGHVALSQKKYKEAADLYMQYLQKQTDKDISMAIVMEKERRHLIDAGVDSHIVTLIADAVDAMRLSGKNILNGFN